MTFKYLTAAFLVTNFFFSLPPWYIIYKHISKKPILSVSLVDLIYRDTIFYVLFLDFFASTAIVDSLMYGGDSFSLTWELALVHSITINILSNTICISLTFSAGLRLISLVRNSEAAGEATTF